MTTTGHSAVARARALGLRAVIGSAAAVAMLSLAAGPAIAAAPPAFNSIPSTIPGNVASIGFEATSTSEFGDYIILGGTERSRAALPVTIVMSSWACQSDEAGGPVCTTTPGATFAQPLTLTMYAVDHSGSVPAVGAQLLQVDHTFNIPYRPSYDPTDTCTTGKWRNAADGTCYSGIAHTVTFTLPAGADLPNELIWSLAYNTGSSGYHHTGDQTKPYNSLNIGAETKAAPSPGSEGETDGIFVNSRWAKMYGDPLAGTGTFRDTTGWTANKPLVCFGVTCPTSDPAVAPSPTPFETVLGATSGPNRTPPITSTTGTPSGDSSPALILLICNLFGFAAIAAVATRRRSLRRRIDRG